MSNVYTHELYAYVVDGKILGFPVLPLHIENRGHPVSMYVPVVNGIVVQEKDFHYVNSKPRYDPDKNVVVLDQELVEMSAQAILNKLYEGKEASEHLFIQHVHPSSIPLVFSQISKIAQKRLDEFANQKNYDDIFSLVGYSSSTIPRFQADAQKGIEARDNTWMPLIAFMETLVSGGTHVPRDVNEIISLIPALTWD